MTPQEAERAIYIDFECLAAEPPHPALLGILDPGDVFEQLIVDPRLAPARVASRNVRVLDACKAIEQLVRRPEDQDRLLVGWSFFDRNVAIRIAPHLETVLRARYQNAIQTARPWRQAIHPSFKITRDDDFAPKHTLYKYALLTGYPGARHLSEAEPARWIRHTLDQLAATGGRYRATTSQTKRDWHKLLAYNRHDCLALRHVTQKAAAELQSWRGFLKTIFCAFDDGREVCFTVDSRSRRLHALLERHRARQWAFLTAWNPAPRTLSREENDRRQRALIGELGLKDYDFLPGISRAADGSWEEESLLVLNISKGAAVSLAQKYSQLAIVFGEKGGPAVLVSAR
jgi:hypothetical protein